jgi:Fic family protein
MSGVGASLQFIVTIMEERESYYSALAQISAGDLDITPWLVWFLAQVEAAMRSSEPLVGALVQKAKFWMAHAQSDLNARQRKALNRILDAEPTGFEGGMTNSKYVNLTKASCSHRAA